MGKVLLRDYEEQEQNAVYALHIKGLKQTGTYIESPEFREEWDKDLLDIPGTYQNEDGRFLVALCERHVVGMGGFRRFDERSAVIKRMRVDPEFQGQGIGGRLLDTMLADIKECGYTRAVLDTASEMVAAQHLYESRGFELYKRDIQYGQGMMYYQKEL